MIKEAIEKIVMKEDLTYDEAYTVMNEIMSGETSQTQNAAFLAALSTKSTKKETEDEILGCAKAMREHATEQEALIYPQQQHLLQQQLESRWQSMAIVQPHPLVVQLTVLKPLELILTRALRNVRSYLLILTSASSLLRNTIHQ